jgi:hypothetical protein
VGRSSRGFDKAQLPDIVMGKVDRLRSSALVAPPELNQRRGNSQFRSDKGAILLLEQRGEGFEKRDVLMQCRLFGFGVLEIVAVDALGDDKFDKGDGSAQEGGQLFDLTVFDHIGRDQVPLRTVSPPHQIPKS